MAIFDQNYRHRSLAAWKKLYFGFGVDKNHPTGLGPPSHPLNFSGNDSQDPVTSLVTDSPPPGWDPGGLLIIPSLVWVCCLVWGLVRGVGSGLVSGVWSGVWV